MGSEVGIRDSHHPFADHGAADATELLASGDVDALQAPLGEFPGELLRPGPAARRAGARRVDRFRYARAGDVGVLEQEAVELVDNYSLDDALDVRVAQLALGLAFELGFGNPNRDDAGQTFPGVFARDALALVSLDQVAVRSGGAERAGDRSNRHAARRATSRP